CRGGFRSRNRDVRGGGRGDEFPLCRRRLGEHRRAQAAGGAAEQAPPDRRQRQRDEDKGPEHSENYKPTSLRSAASSSTEIPSASAFASLLPGSAPATT